MKRIRDPWCKMLKTKMIKTCPKCGRKGEFGFFDFPYTHKHRGVFEHKEEERNILGIRKKTRCFVTTEELEKTSWFAEFSKKRVAVLKTEGDGGKWMDEMFERTEKDIEEMMKKMKKGADR